VSTVVRGPSCTGTQYVDLCSWGVSTERFAGATVSVSAITDALVFAAPGLLFILWVMLGRPAEQGGNHVWLIGLIPLAVTVVTVVLVSAAARSEWLDAWLGRLGEGCVNRVSRPCWRTWMWMVSRSEWLSTKPAPKQSPSRGRRPSLRRRCRWA
jgi:hypothetical protein